MRKLILVLPLLGLCSLAHAIGPGIYLGAGVTQAKLDNVGKDFNVGSVDNFKLDNTAWKLIAGVRPIKVFGAELNYDDLGHEHLTRSGISFNGSGKAMSAFAMGYLPLPLPIIDVYAKAGLARWNAKAAFSSLPSFQFDDHGTEFAYGAGIQAHIGGLAARLEYEQFNIPHTDGVELLSLGVTFTIL